MPLILHAEAMLDRSIGRQCMAGHDWSVVSQWLASLVALHDLRHPQTQPS